MNVHKEEEQNENFGMNVEELKNLEKELGLNTENTQFAENMERLKLRKDSIKSSAISNNSNIKSKHFSTKSNFLPFNNTNATYPGQARREKIIKKLNNECYNQIKETDKKLLKKDELYEELNYYSKKVNDIKKANRDEDLLRMQKENQEIELQLKQLKNKDKSELHLKEEESKKLIEDLNNLFNEKKKEALDKDEERKKVIEEIKQIKKDQEDHKNTIKKLTQEKEDLTHKLSKLDEDVEKLKKYKEFIDMVIESSNEASNNDYDKLKEKFENLIERMHEIQNDIAEQENEIQKIKKEQNELLRKNDKQSQNKRLLELENEIKEYLEKNKKLEKEIEEMQNKNQKKDSDTHQIKLSINNLYIKSKYKENDEQKRRKDSDQTKLLNKGSKDKKEFDLNVSDTVLCNKLSEINERIMDLINIYKELEP